MALTAVVIPADPIITNWNTPSGSTKWQAAQRSELITFDEAGASVTAVSKPENGTITDNADGTWTYTPKADYYGSDAFTYTVASGDGAFANGTVTIKIKEVNDEAQVIGERIRKQ